MRPLSPHAYVRPPRSAATAHTLRAGPPAEDGLMNSQVTPKSTLRASPQLVPTRISFADPGRIDRDVPGFCRQERVQMRPDDVPWIRLERTLEQSAELACRVDLVRPRARAREAVDPAPRSAGGAWRGASRLGAGIVRVDVDELRYLRAGPSRRGTHERHQYGRRESPKEKDRDASGPIVIGHARTVRAVSTRRAGSRHAHCGLTVRRPALDACGA